MPAQPRPPWALAEAGFLDACTRCGACVDACPTGLLQAGMGGFPVADFAGGDCDFCRRCATACQPGALRRTETRPWDLVAVIGDGCLAEQNVVCRTCGEACEANAIRFVPRIGGVAIPQLNIDNCTGCGQCLAPCPTRAIAMVRQSDIEEIA